MHSMLLLREVTRPADARLVDAAEGGVADELAVFVHPDGARLSEQGKRGAGFGLRAAFPHGKASGPVFTRKTTVGSNMATKVYTKPGRNRATDYKGHREFMLGSVRFFSHQESWVLGSGFRAGGSRGCTGFQ